MKFIDDEVEQLLTGGPLRTRQRQNVTFEPLGEGAQVVRLLMRP